MLSVQSEQLKDLDECQVRKERPIAHLCHWYKQTEAQLNMIGRDSRHAQAKPG